jgi:hypothetical protein
MESANFKRNFCGAGIAVAILFTFSYTNSPALPSQASQGNANRIVFTEHSSNDNDGFALSRNPNSSENPDNGENASNANNAQTKLKVRSTTNTDDVSDVLEETSNNLPPKLEKLPDWQLMHSHELPYGDYFIDTRIVGAVRYHADFSLETEYVILRELNNIQKDLSQYLAIPHPKETMEVFIFQSKATYQRFLGEVRELRDAPFDREALYFRQSSPGMVLIYRNPNMMEDLRHEMTHAFLHASLPYIPLWLDEGLAEYFEKPRDTRARINPYFTSVSRKIMFGQVPSLAKLEKMRYFDQMGVNEYCEAWSWVHFMMHHSRATHQMLAGYIRLLAEQGEKTPPLDSFLSKTVPETKKSYLEHFRNWKNRQNSNTAISKSPADPADPEKKSSGSKLSLGWSESVFR